MVIEDERIMDIHFQLQFENFSEIQLLGNLEVVNVSKGTNIMPYKYKNKL